MAEEISYELSAEHEAELQKALSWNEGEGYNGDGPEDVADVEEVVY